MVFASFPAEEFTGCLFSSILGVVPPLPGSKGLGRWDGVTVFAVEKDTKVLYLTAELASAYIEVVNVPVVKAIHS